MITILSICSALFEDWNYNNVCYCHWKGSNHIINGLTGASDLDILVDETHNNLATDLLRKNGFKQFKTQWGIRYKGVQDWIGLDKPTGKLVHIHYHNYMVMGHTGVMEYVFPLQKEVLESRILLEEYGVYVTNPNYELVSFFVRIGLEYPNKKLMKSTEGYILTAKSIEEVIYLKERSSEEQIKNILDTLFPKTSSVILEIITKETVSAEDIKILSHLCKKYVKGNNALWINIIKSKCIMAIMHYIIPMIHKSWGTPLRKVPISEEGFTIAFLGQDGAGKSTVTEDICKWLSWKIDYRLNYLGYGVQFDCWERRLQKRLQKRKDPLSALIRMWLPFRIAIKLSENSKNVIIRSKKYALNGTVILYDRYPQTMYSGINDGPKIRSSILPQLSSIVLRKIASCYASIEEKNLEKAVKLHPDLVVKLMLPVEESLRRKPHENYEAVKAKHEIIKSLPFEKSKVYTIDVTQPYESEILQIKSLIWDNIK